MPPHGPVDLLAEIPFEQEWKQGRCLAVQPKLMRMALRTASTAFN
jgi:hypothetical protein